MSLDDQKRFLDCYFGKRNGKKLTPQDGLNYTEETLSYMASSARANEISKLVSAFMKDKPVHLIDVCAGIGGFTMAFLDNSKIKKVISYELDSDRRDILSRNLKDYDFDPDRFKVLGKFDGLDSKDIPDLFGKEIENLVVFFDPPWLPDHISGHESTPDEYLLDGITIGDKTLEEWLVSLSKIIPCKLVIFRVPPNYKFEKVDKWHCRGQPVKNSLYYICVPSAGKMTPSLDSTNTKRKEKNPDLNQNPKDKNLIIKRKEKFLSNQKKTISNSEDKTKNKMLRPNTSAPQSFTQSVPILTSGRSQPSQQPTSILQRLPTIVHSQPPSTLRPSTPFVPSTTSSASATNVTRQSIRGQIQGKRGIQIKREQYGPEIITMASEVVDTEEEVKWVNGLLKFLYDDILPHAVTDPKMRSMLVSASAARIWIPAFTHSSYNPNDGENYEVLEKLGDSVMKLNFTWYMIKRYSNINEGQLGRLSDHYLSKEFQANLSNSYGFSEYILTNLDLSIHVREDVLEAFFGALFTASEIFLPKFQISTSSSPLPRDSGRLSLSAIKVSPACDVCYKFLSSIFDSGNIIIDLSLVLGPPTNQVKEIFEKMGWGNTNNVIQEIESEDRLANGEFTITLKLTDRFLEWIHRYNLQHPTRKVVIKNRIFARVTESTLKVAKKRAYFNGLEYLKTKGITLNWAEAMKTAAPTTDPYLVEYYPLAKARAIKEGMVKIIFSKGKEGSKVLFTQLLGVDENGRKYVLATINGTPRSRREQKPTKSILKRAALEHYYKHGQTQEAIHYLDVY